MLTGTERAVAQVGPSEGLDHIILYTGSLAQGSATFARLTGVTPTWGGQHPGRGTQNALVSLGQGRYLELLAPTVDTVPVEPLGLVGWAIHTSDITALRQRLGTEGIALADPAPGSRRQPDGGLLTWTTAALPGVDSPNAPFFIEWGRQVAHPSTTTPTGCTLTEFLITEPDPTGLSGLVRLLGLAVVVRAGPERSASVTLQCPRGTVRFTSD